jgi:predicted nucleotidyltransferase
MKIATLLQSLSDAGVKYVLVGGLAVQLHGFMRATFDIDLVLAMDDENLARFIDVARQLGLVPAIPVPIEALRDSRLVDQWHREKGMLAFSLREPQAGGNVVDVLVRPEVPFDRLLANAVMSSLSGREVPVAAIPDLLAMKRKSNRARDQLDVAALEKIMRGEDPNA